MDVDDTTLDINVRETKYPSTLYTILCQIIAQNLDAYCDLKELIPLHVIIDILDKCCSYELIDTLKKQLSNLKLMAKILRHPSYRNTVHKCFHMVIKKDKDFDHFLACQKISEYIDVDLALKRAKKNITDNKELQKCQLKMFEFCHEAILLSDFLKDGGHYKCAGLIFQNITFTDENGNIPPNYLSVSFEMTLRLARCLTLDCQFIPANKCIFNASMVLNYLQSNNNKPNCALFYTTCSLYLFSLSQYDKAHNLSRQAVLELDKSLQPKVVIDTLRQACKTCIIKRIFRQAHTYIKQALYLAKYWFGVNNSKYAECLSDYGFYLLSIDSVSSAVKFYNHALNIRQDLFGEHSVITAITHEDLAYAIYVRDYSHGGFSEARVHAERALKVLSELLYIDHLLLASSKRVLALILEEVAIDSSNSTKETQLLRSAELLHLDSLRLAQDAFGEDNVQTAKHYGNLGRLYQSMKKYKKAEANHMMAIRIKEKLLGKEDYEVASSIGHLASLYNYDMKKYDFAEEMYLKSISIGRTLFGVWYSGLEYDYRGLIHLYNETGRYEQMFEYQTLLVDWKLARDNMTSQQNKDVQIDEELNNNEMTLDEIFDTVKNISRTCLLKK